MGGGGKAQAEFKHIQSKELIFLLCRLTGELLSQYRRCVDEVSRQLLPVNTPLIAKTLAARPKEPPSNGQTSTSASAPSQTR